MKTTASLLLMALCCLLAAVQGARPRREEKYTSQYDNVDFQQILENDRLLKGYVDCLLDKGPCSPDGQTLRDSVPDALANGCAKCTEVQKEKSKLIIDHLKKNKPAIWEEVQKKHDPTGLYEKVLEKA